MANVLLDTDIFIDHIRRTRAIRPRGHRIFYSVVTRAELYAGGNEPLARRVLEPYTEIPVDRAVSERAGRVRRKDGIPLPDAFIAATAQEHGLTLITRNTKDFRGLKGLRVRSQL